MDLGGGSVGGFFDLVWVMFGEGNSEYVDEVVVGGFDGDVGFNQSLLFVNEGLEFVGGEVEFVEVGKVVFVLNFVNFQVNFMECMIFIFLEVSEGDFEDMFFECIVCVFEISCVVYKSFVNIRNLLDIV